MQTQEMASMDSNLTFFGDKLARATAEARAARAASDLLHVPYARRRRG